MAPFERHHSNGEELGVQFQERGGQVEFEDQRNAWHNIIQKKFPFCAEMYTRRNEDSVRNTLNTARKLDELPHRAHRPDVAGERTLADAELEATLAA